MTDRRRQINETLAPVSGAPGPLGEAVAVLRGLDEALSPLVCDVLDRLIDCDSLSAEVEAALDAAGITDTEAVERLTRQITAELDDKPFERIGAGLRRLATHLAALGSQRLAAARDPDASPGL